MWWWKKVTNEGDWAPEQVMLATASVAGKSVTLRNIRNCQYESDGTFAVRHYDKTFDLQNLKRAWYIVAPFPIKSLAHVFVSFEFKDGTCLSISIEARRHKGESYSMFKGCFNYFGLMYVVGDEHDLITVRALRCENRIYLYPLRTSKECTQKLFLDMLARANELAERSEFYNTLFNNCGENLAHHLNVATGKKIHWSWRTLLLDYSDRLLYKSDLIDSTLPFPTLRKKSLITPAAVQYVNDPDFSQKIRSGLV